MEYKIVSVYGPTSRPDALTIEVNKEIDKGWEPIGGVSVRVAPRDQCELFQAMVYKSVM